MFHAPDTNTHGESGGPEPLDSARESSLSGVLRWVPLDIILSKVARVPESRWQHCEQWQPTGYGAFRFGGHFGVGIFGIWKVFQAG